MVVVNTMTDAAGSKLVQNLRLEADEHVLMALQPSAWTIWGFYIWTLGLYEFWRRAKVYVLTDHRVLLRKGRINKTEQNLPLVYVQDARVTTALGAGAVEVATAGGSPTSLSKMDLLKTDEARQFADAILAQARSARTPGAPQAGASSPSGQGDVYDQLRKVGELHDSGVLTDEEFESKKSELLGRVSDPPPPDHDEPSP